LPRHSSHFESVVMDKGWYLLFHHPLFPPSVRKFIEVLKNANFWCWLYLCPERLGPGTLVLLAILVILSRFLWAKASPSSSTTTCSLLGVLYACYRVGFNPKNLKFLYFWSAQVSSGCACIEVQNFVIYFEIARVFNNHSVLHSTAIPPKVGRASVQSMAMSEMVLEYMRRDSKLNPPPWPGPSFCKNKYTLATFLIPYGKSKALSTAEYETAQRR
jgi:hypothetical protein